MASPMPSYAQSSLNATYYELLSLDEALELERAANDQYRDDFGDDFADYLGSQLELVHATYDAGRASGTVYSIKAPKGEFSSSIYLRELVPLSQSQFESARERGWPL